jgi:hypothetical protein
LFYQLRAREINLVEIGVWTGKSCLVWFDYFPSAKIFGIDINPKCAAGLPFNLVIGNSTQPEILEQLPERLDVVIDDGSHIPAEQIATFELLFPRLADDGIYIIEDIYPKMFGWEFFEYQKKLIDRLYEERNFSVSFHRSVTIIRKHKQDMQTG